MNEHGTPSDEITTDRVTPRRSSAPTLTGTVRAVCGCTGLVHATSGGRYPTVSVRIAVPCTTGHPDKVAAGVLERFTPAAVHPTTVGV